MRKIEDALDRPLSVREHPTRIVSLVPSVTELLFDLGAGDRVVAVSRYCSEPAHALASLLRVGGQKDPDVAGLLALAPDLVLAVKEENLARDIASIERAGVPVYVADVRSLEDAVALVGEICDVVDGEARAADAIRTRVQAGIAEARRLAAGLSVRLFCPVWRDPLIGISSDTFMGDLLAACGAELVLAGRPQDHHGHRYPKVTLAELRAARPDAILLPTEPYPFTERDVAELSSIAPAAIIDGKLLQWYGARTAGIPHVVAILRRLTGR